MATPYRISRFLYAYSGHALCYNMYKDLLVLHYRKRGLLLCSPNSQYAAFMEWWPVFTTLLHNSVMDAYSGPE